MLSLDRLYRFWPQKWSTDELFIGPRARKKTCGTAFAFDSDFILSIPCAHLWFIHRHCDWASVNAMHKRNDIRQWHRNDARARARPHWYRHIEWNDWSIYRYTRNQQIITIIKNASQANQFNSKILSDYIVHGTYGIECTMYIRVRTIFILVYSILYVSLPLSSPPPLSHSLSLSIGRSATLAEHMLW